MRSTSSVLSPSISTGDEAASTSTSSSASSLSLSPRLPAARRAGRGSALANAAAATRPRAQSGLQDPLQVQMRDLQSRLLSLSKQLHGPLGGTGSPGGSGPASKPPQQQQPSVAAAAAAAALSLGVDAALTTAGRASSQHLLWTSSLQPPQAIHGPGAANHLNPLGHARRHHAQQQLLHAGAAGSRTMDRYSQNPSPTRARTAEPGLGLGAGGQEQPYGSQRVGTMGAAQAAARQDMYSTQRTPRAQPLHSPGRGLGGRSWALGSLGLALTGAGTGSAVRGAGRQPDVLGARRGPGAAGSHSRQWSQGAARSAWEGTGAPQAQGLTQLEEERLRTWVQELRHERRRLEEKLLMGDSQGMQALDQRDDLEKQVLGLSRQRDALDAELASMSSMQQAVQELSAEVEALRQELYAEAEASAQHQAARSQLEAANAEVVSKLELLQQQHAQAVEELGRDRRILAAKYKKASQRAALADEAGGKVLMELQQTHSQLLTAERERAEARAAADALRRANAQMQEQVVRISQELDSRVSELHRLLEDERRESRSSKQQLQDVSQDAAASDLRAKEMSSRAEFLRSDREKLTITLQAEQQQSADQKLRIEALEAQVRALQRKTEDVTQNACLQLEALQREYEIASRA